VSAEQTSIYHIVSSKKEHEMEQKGRALANQVCIIQFLSSVKAAEPRLKTEVQIIST
jgi:hypothetical protein